MAVYLTEIPVDLALPPRQYPMPHQFAMGDNNAYTITSLLYNSSMPDMELLDGTVSGELVRPDGETVALTGEKGEEVRVINADHGGMCNATPCSVTLPQACFAYPGRVTLTIKLTDGTTITQALSMSAVVVRTSTDVVVDPGDVVPDIGALQAAAAEALEAAVDARAAASSAVRYDTAQTLTAEQKAQARANAGAASETALTAMASMTEYGTLLAQQSYTRAGVTVVRVGTCSTINGTRSGSSIVRFRMYERGITREGSAPTAAQNVSGGAQIKAGRTYRLCGRLISGTYTLPEPPVYYNDNWRLNAYYAGTTSAWDSRTLIRDGVNYVEECTPEADGEICVWLATIPGSTFTDAVLEIWLEDVTDTLRPGTIATQEEPSSSSATYHAGDLLTVGGTLYKATQAIAAGEVITPGTNVVETTVAAQLAALEARIAALEG